MIQRRSDLPLRERYLMLVSNKRGGILASLFASRVACPTQCSAAAPRSGGLHGNKNPSRPFSRFLFTTHIDWRTFLALFVALEMAAFTSRFYGPVYSEVLWPQVGLPLTVAFAALSLAQVGLRRRGVWLVTLYFFWYLGVLVLNRWFFAYEYPAFRLVLYRLLFSTLVCYPLGCALADGGRTKAVRAVLSAIVIWFAGLSAVSIYCAATATLWPSPYEAYGLLGALRLETGAGFRLQMFAPSNVSAAALVMSALLALFLWLTAGHKAYKAWHALCFVLLCTALGLTRSHAGMLAFAAGMALLPFVWIRGRIYAASPGRAWLAGIVCAGVMTALCLAGLDLVAPAMDKLSQAIRPARWQRVQVAEGQAAPKLVQPRQAGEAETAGASETADANAQRGWWADVGLRNALDGRTKVWGAAVQAILANPRLLIKGTTLERVMLAVNPYLPQEKGFAHLNNSYLEVLVGMGAPGFILLLALLWLLGKYSLRLTLDMSQATGLGARFLPAVLLAGLVMAMMESFYFTGQYFADRLFFIVAGLIAAWASRLEKDCHGAEGKARVFIENRH